MKRIRLSAGWIVVVIACGCASFSQAADKTWIGSTSANWSTTTIWTPNGVPAAGESVSISNIVAGLYLTVPSGTAAMAASISFDNNVNTNTTLIIANGGSLTVGGIITNPVMSTALFQVNNSVASNAASVFTVSSLAGRELALVAGSGPQYLTTGYDIKYNTQLSVTAGTVTQTNYYRQTNGTITITSSDYGLTLLDQSGPTNAGAAGYYILDGGTLKSDRIGIGNGNGNNNNVWRWPGSGFLEFNNGTVQTRAAANNVWFENGSTFETFNNGTVKSRDMQRNTSYPVTVRLAQSGTHTFNASYSDSHIVFSPSVQLVDKPGEVGGLVKTGPGNLIFTGGGLFATNTWSGDTTNTAGKVQVNYNLLAGTVGSLALNNAYSPGSKMVLNGGGFELVGRNNATNSSFSNVNLTSGGGYAESYTIPVPSTAGLFVGQSVSNSFLPAGTYIRRIISGTQIGLSHMSTSTVSQAGQTLTFGSASFTSDQTVSNVELVASSSPVTVTPGGTSTTLTFVNVSGTGGLSKLGTGTLRLTGSITYAGTTVITGMLDFASSANITLTNAISGGGIFRQSGAVTTAVDMATNYLANFAGAVVVDGGTLRQGSGSAAQYRGFTSASSYTINSGATLITARDAMNGSAPLNLNGGTFKIAPGGGAQALGPVTLNGGTMVTSQGMGGPWSAFMLNGNFVVTGTVASVIRADPGLYNGVHLAFNAAAGTFRTFRVDDVTGNADPDLTISANLLESSHTGNSAGLIKTGAGTLLLSGGTNIYSGATIISNGTLLVSGGMSNSAVIVRSGAAFGTADTTVSKVASLTLETGSKMVWKYDGNTHTAGRIAVLGTLNLPSSATLDVSGSGYLYSGQTLFSAPTINGATDLSGWTVTGALANSQVVRVGNSVTLLVNRGTQLRVK